MKSTKARSVIHNYQSKATKRKRKKHIDILRLICWTIIPLITFTLLVFDALMVYTLTDKRMIVLGVVLAVILLPFFSEITIKNLSLKRTKTNKDQQ